MLTPAEGPAEGPRPTDAPSPARSPRSRVHKGVVAAIVGALVLASVAGLSWWAVARKRQAPTPPTAASALARYEAGWSSAMRKLRVDATLPERPVDVTALHVTGRRPFEVTLIAEEITALMNVYRYEAEAGQLSLDGIEVAFPAEGVARLDATIFMDDTPYSARAVVPLTFDAKGVHSPGLTSLSVEGFDVGSVQRRQASDVVLAFLNAYLRALPGVTLEEARIEEDGVAVKGMAPVRIENP